MGVLVTSQVLGGVGLATGFAVGALLAEQVTGSASLSGLAQTAGVLGGALAAVPLAALSMRRGRRWGLSTGYALAAAGGVVIVASAAIGMFLLLLAGMALFGAGQASTMQARYAATDLAAPDRRGRALSTVVWATTLGAVLGPTLAEPAGNSVAALPVPALAGPFAWSCLAFLAAAVSVALLLRPDPLVVAREVAQQPADPVSRGFGLRRVVVAVRGSPSAVLALTGIVCAHAVMIAVMSMTPVHLGHGGATLRVIGIVFSVHIAGMFAFSPVVGWLVDRLGRVPVLLAGCGMLLVSLLVAGPAAGHESSQVGVGLFLLGLGWSFCVVAGSTLLTDSVDVDVRPAVQGAADLVMGLGGAAAGGLAGLVVGTAGYGALAAVSSLAVLPVLVSWGYSLRNRERDRAAP